VAYSGHAPSPRGSCLRSSSGLLSRIVKVLFSFRDKSRKIPTVVADPSAAVGPRALRLIGYKRLVSVPDSK
jgi:hypothetical protein